MMALGLAFNMMYNIEMIKRNSAGVFLVLLLVFLPAFSFAQPQGGAVPPPANQSGGDGKIVNPLASKGIDSVQGLIKILLQGLIRIGFPIVALAILYSGFLFVAARGNSEKLETAKQSLMYSIIGAVILLGSWSIAMLISETVLNLGS
jgi:hypothetical protein